MPDQKHTSTPKNTLSIISVVLGAIISALIVGSGVYAYERNRNTKTINDLQAQIDTLKSQVALATPTPVATVTPIVSAAPTADPTAGWSTYTSVNFPINFKYPATWNPDKSEIGSICLYDTENPLSLDGVTICNIVISIEKDTFGGSIQNYSSSSHAPIMPHPQSQSVLIGGKTAYAEEGTNANNQTPAEQVVFASGYVFQFSPNDTTTISTFNTLLSTVSFR